MPYKQAIADWQRILLSAKSGRQGAVDSLGFRFLLHMWPVLRRRIDACYIYIYVHINYTVYTYSHIHTYIHIYIYVYMDEETLYIYVYVYVCAAASHLIRPKPSFTTSAGSCVFVHHELG